MGAGLENAALSHKIGTLMPGKEADIVSAADDSAWEYPSPVSAHQLLRLTLRAGA
jgi:hypothetical protein